MRTGAGVSWLAVGLLLGCGLDPSEVVGVYDGQGSSSSGASGDGSSSSGGGSAGTGPVADGSAGSDTGTPSTSAEGGTTNAVDPSTTEPGTTTSGDPPGTTGPASTSDEPGSSSGPPPPPTCEEIYGAASGYLLCDEDEDSCTFSLNTGGMSCGMICSAYGQSCLGAIDNPGGVTCMEQGPTSCDTVKTTTICICSK